MSFRRTELAATLLVMVGLMLLGLTACPAI
jgi:hypothetical protein